ncbi:ORF6N domain-containing protein [Odoribacter splanchnicus]|uniref:ORF6N domain-containing protein n=2 Tax=Odoribacter splanchnicus TaxID=28118 RepID=A0A412TKZ2_9BACT|nr:ORF6N domain-containing protein [Odoribacter splanchnicus]OUN97574.1 DNA-binding protein [Odoribacter splanchnicus]RGU54416.1 ORF6N domain-containing protein [Odoribacter splanchnicus]
MNQLELIQSKIYEIRGQRVMLDFDLAQMYGTETAQLKRAVRRNKKRFDGEDFMFEVTRDELSRCQIGTLNKSRGSNIKYLPFAFAMLSSVLNSETAIEINKGIMRAFVAIRQLIANPPPDKHSLLQKEVKELKQYIEEIFTDQNDINEDTRMQLELINQTLAELQVHQKLSDKPHRPIGFIRPEEN